MAVARMEVFGLAMSCAGVQRRWRSDCDHQRRKL